MCVRSGMYGIPSDLLFGSARILCLQSCSIDNMRIYFIFNYVFRQVDDITQPELYKSYKLCTVYTLL